MKLIPYDEKKLGHTWKPCKNQKIIQEFIDSGEKCVKLEGWTHKDAFHCQRSMTLSIARMHVNQVIAISRKGEVFLLRTDI